MLLRITAVIMIIMLSFCAEGAIRTTDRYEYRDAEKDLTILTSILSRHPEDLTTLKRLINLTFSMESFDRTETYCDRYLAIEKNSEAAYLKIIAAASRGDFKRAAGLVEPFISEYKSDLTSRDIILLKYRESLYRKSSVTRGFPEGSVKTAWGDNSLIKTVISRDGLFAGYNTRGYDHVLFKVTGGTAVPSEKYPDYLSGLPPESINYVSLSDDGREVLVSSGDDDSSSIYLRKYIPAKKRWSSWDEPDGLNPGKWNHYPNFVDSNTVLFSSSDGADYDLYISQKDENGEWSDAHKLPGVNTPMDEISAFLHPDGETLYFSSNGHEGMGGFDIYGARLLRKGDSFEVSGIKNVTSANTYRNEKYPLFITASGDEAYFNFRAGEKHDIYKCGDIPYKPASAYFYNADVIDDSTGTPVDGASAEYRSINGEFVLNKPVHSDGYTGTVLRRNIKYTLTVSAEGYEKSTRDIAYTGKDDKINDIIKLKRKSVDAPRAVRSILFTAVKPVDCRMSIVKPVQDLLEKNLDSAGDTSVRGKNILSQVMCGDTGCAAAEGAKNNTDYVVFGTITGKQKSAMKSLGDSGEDQYLAKKVTGTTYILELKLLQLSSGKVIVSFRKSTENPGTLQGAANEFLRKIAAEIK